MIFFKKKKVALGEGSVEQYTLFESKRFGGIWFYSWGSVGGKRDIGQVRYHTHAFNSIAITLNGSYNQEIITEDGTKKEKISKRFRPRFLPRHYTHRIINAEKNTWTCVIFGRWSPNWYEYFEDTKTWVRYGFGRKKLDKFENKDYNWIKQQINKQTKTMDDKNSDTHIETPRESSAIINRVILTLAAAAFIGCAILINTHLL